MTKEKLFSSSKQTVLLSDQFVRTYETVRTLRSNNHLIENFVLIKYSYVTELIGLELSGKILHIPIIFFNIIKFRKNMRFICFLAAAEKNPAENIDESSSD